MELLEKVLDALQSNPNLSLIIGLIVLLVFGIAVIVPLAKPIITALTTKSGSESEVLSSLSDIANERLENIEKKLDLAIEQNKVVIARFDAMVKASQAQVVTLEKTYDALNKAMLDLVRKHDYDTKKRYETVETFLKDVKQVINFLALEVRNPEKGKDTEPVIITDISMTIVEKDEIP